MKRFFKWFPLTFLLTILLAAGICHAEEMPVHTQFAYGQSEMGRELICHRIGTQDAARSMLLVFGVHGFEDSYPHDGQVLKLIAENLISHYTANVQELQNFCLYIIPCANPDGLLDGYTNEGFGRCNANGLDINRDFPAGWTPVSNERYLTGNGPFSTAEARAIRDLTEQIQPDYGMDVHGWISFSGGEGQMAQIFSDHFDLSLSDYSTCGTLYKWLKTFTRDAAMLELPYYPDSRDYVSPNTLRMISALDAWMSYCRNDT